VLLQWHEEVDVDVEDNCSCRITYLGERYELLKLSGAAMKPKSRALVIPVLGPLTRPRVPRVAVPWPKVHVVSDANKTVMVSRLFACSLDEVAHVG
jgi:hypothetical protein